jgi:hypothetical protein
MSGTCLSEYVSGLPSTIPPYHPEFGYLCPSPRVRRHVRLALISGAIGMLIGAVAILSLLDKRLAQTSASDQTSSLAETDRNDTDVDRPSLGKSNGLFSEDLAFSLGENCVDSARSFLDRSCRSVRKHKRGTRSATRLAIVGVSDPAEDAVAQEPAVIDRSSMLANAGQRGENSADATHASSLAAESKKITRARQHPRIPTQDGVNAFASASTSVEWHRYQNMPRSDPHFNAATGGRTW